MKTKVAISPAKLPFFVGNEISFEVSVVNHLKVLEAFL